MKRTAWNTIPTFLGIWLMVGFALGTFVLVGPVRWITAWMRGAGYGGAGETVVMVVVILLYVVASAFLARWITGRALRTHVPWVRWGLPAATVALAAAALWGWFQPGLYAGMAGGEEQRLALRGGAEFVFGAYPDRERLRELQAEGFTAVVSLQHPAVVPMEPQGIAAEKEAAREVGIRFIHAPMLPWVSENEEALALIRELAEAEEGKFYVHCGLGRDRVNVVRRMLEGSGARLASTGATEEATSFADRTEPMERGMPVRLEEDVWLIPHPNEHEIFGNMLAGQYTTVVTLLHPDAPRERVWRDSLEATLGDYDVSTHRAPLLPGAEAAAREIARMVRGLPRPVVVVAPGTAPSADTATAATFQRGYAAHLRTLGVGRGAPAAAR